jgi:hypothetical protein
LLANRLQTNIKSIIHENQYGFIKSRTILYCLAWAYEYLHHCHKSKKEVVALKLYFEKTFEKVEHSFIMAVLQAKGFGPSGVYGFSKYLMSFSMGSLIQPSNAKEGSGREILFPLSFLLYVLMCYNIWSMHLCIMS